jgi:hypothetical protein
MALYSDCNLLLKVPLNYSRNDELKQFLNSKLDGCKIKIEEFETDEPFAQSVEVSENTQLSGLEVGKEWTLPGRPTPIESDSAPALLQAAKEAIEEFIGNSKK